MEGEEIQDSNQSTRGHVSRERVVRSGNLQNICMLTRVIMTQGRLMI